MGACGGGSGELWRKRAARSGGVKGEEEDEAGAQKGSREKQKFRTHVPIGIQATCAHMPTALGATGCREGGSKVKRRGRGREKTTTRKKGRRRGDGEEEKRERE